MKRLEILRHHFGVSTPVTRILSPFSFLRAYRVFIELAGSFGSYARLPRGPGWLEPLEKFSVRPAPTRYSDPGLVGVTVARRFRLQMHARLSKRAAYLTLSRACLISQVIA